MISSELKDNESNNKIKVKKAYQAPAVINLTSSEENAGALIGIGAVWVWAIVAGPVWP